MVKMSDAGHDLDASSSTQQISKVYECPVCFLVYDRTARLPKSLRCGHTICLACVRQLVVHSTRLRCPSCRKEHSLEDSAEDLPTNFSLLEALDTMCVECHSQCAVETNKKMCKGCFQRFISSSKKELNESVERFNTKITKLIEESQEKVDPKAINTEADKLCEDVSQLFVKYHKALDEREEKLKDKVSKLAASRIKQENEKQVEHKEELVIIEKKLQTFVSSLKKKTPRDTMKHLEHLQALSDDIDGMIESRSYRWYLVNNSMQTSLHECQDLITTITRASSLSRRCGACKDERVMSIGVTDSSTNGMWYGNATVAQVFENGLNKPHDVAVSPLDGSIVVANEGSRSLVFYREKAKTSDEKEHIHESIIPYEFQHVVGNLGEEGSMFFGVTIDKNGQIFVTDQKLNCVWVYDGNGTLMKKIGTKGKGQLEFNYPTGLTIDIASGHLYICDFSNRRVQVITTNGRFVRSFGSDVLTCMDEIHGAWYIAVGKGKSGKVYLMNTYGTVYMFSKNGKLLQSYFQWGYAEYGLALDLEGNLLTAANHPNVLLQSTKFQIVIQIGESRYNDHDDDEIYKFADVRGVAVNRAGNMIVCDHGANTLKILVEK